MKIIGILFDIVIICTLFKYNLTNLLFYIKCLIFKDIEIKVLTFNYMIQELE